MENGTEASLLAFTHADIFFDCNLESLNYYYVQSCASFS